MPACDLCRRFEVILPPLVQPGLDLLNSLVLLCDLFPPLNRVHLHSLRRLQHAMQPALLDQRLEDRLDRMQRRVHLLPVHLSLFVAGSRRESQWEVCIQLDEVGERVEGRRGGCSGREECGELRDAREGRRARRMLGSRCCGLLRLPWQRLDCHLGGVRCVCERTRLPELLAEVGVVGQRSPRRGRSS